MLNVDITFVFTRKTHQGTFQNLFTLAWLLCIEPSCKKSLISAHFTQECCIYVPMRAVREHC